MDEESIDNFKGEATKIGGSLFILIPNNVAKFSAIKDGTKLRIWLKQIQQENVE